MVTTWNEHVEKWKDCQRCPLSQQRHRICLARGVVPCDVLFVGIAPGSNENTHGRPFVGPAGKLLDRIIEQAMWEVEDGKPAWTYALTNLVACFPAIAKAEGVNDPELSEIAACRPRLLEFANIAGPLLVVRVGSLVGEQVHHDGGGKFYGADVCDIVHPAAILKGKVPLAQKEMAVQRAAVVLRSAVREALERKERASIPEKDRVAVEWRTTRREYEPPF